jgi:hypothetical protein
VTSRFEQGSYIPAAIGISIDEQDEQRLHALKVQAGYGCWLSQEVERSRPSEKRNGRLVVARRPSHTWTIQGRSTAASFFSHLPPVG